MTLKYSCIDISLCVSENKKNKTIENIALKMCMSLLCTCESEWQSRLENAEGRLAQKVAIRKFVTFFKTTNYVHGYFETKKKIFSQTRR